MLTQLALRALRTPRTPLSPLSQPCARLQPSLTRTLQTSAPRTPSQGAYRKQFQWTSPCPHINISSRPLRSPSPVSVAFHLPSGRRPFSSTGRTHRQNRYNRFNGGGRQSPLFALVQRAKPHHFVIIGLGISGFYFYNTDVVEVGSSSSNASFEQWEHMQHILSIE